MQTRHISKETYVELSERIIEGFVSENWDFENLKAGGLTFDLDIDFREDRETAYTGVEFMGARETYTKTIIDVRRVILASCCEGSEPVRTDFDEWGLNLRYDDDYIAIN